MNLTIPIYIEQLPQEGQSTPVYAVRPLFFPDPIGLDVELQRALAKFAKAMRRDLDSRGRAMRHDSLAEYCFAPEVDEELITLALDPENAHGSLFVPLRHDQRLRSPHCIHPEPASSLVRTRAG